LKAEIFYASKNLVFKKRSDVSMIFRKNNDCGKCGCLGELSGCVITLIGMILAMITIAAAVFVILERKKKKEDEELEDYLENSIQ
jgi:hypothetical protein